AGTALPQGVVEHVHKETEGLPFFLVEYLAVIMSGIGATDGEEWSLPGGVRGLLDSRLASVDGTSRQLLTTAAVIGRSFDFDTLREASGRSEEETVDGLEAVTALGLIREIAADDGERNPTYDFSHEKLRTLVYDQTSLARRRLLHRRVAEALVGRARASGIASATAGQVAYHYRLSGQESEAATYLKLAGEYARSLYANAEALSHFRAALALGHPDTAALHDAIGDMYTLMAEYELAIASYETAAGLCDGTVLATIECKLGAVHNRRGDYDLADSHLQSALNILGEAGPAGERARVLAEWSLTAHQQGRSEHAAALAHDALTLAHATKDVWALTRAHNILGILAGSQRDPATAFHHLEQSLALAEDANDPGARAAALNNLSLLHSAEGNFDQAIDLAETALSLCASQGDRHREAAMHNNLADLLHADGRRDAAMAHLKEAVRIYAEIGVEAGAVQPQIWKLAEW
ncbi:MAG: tetratricopeptide repeat protein, partial [Chloroflexota bacterium]|nr:tetratricopeptide repeat protein [Chloroflexota bacterium]